VEPPKSISIALRKGRKHCTAQGAQISYSAGRASIVLGRGRERRATQKARASNGERARASYWEGSVSVVLRRRRKHRIAQRAQASYCAGGASTVLRRGRRPRNFLDVSRFGIIESAIDREGVEHVLQPPVSSTACSLNRIDYLSHLICHSHIPDRKDESL